MKRIIALFILLFMCIGLWSCNDAKNSNTKFSYPLTEINTVYDKNGNIIQQTLYNELTSEYTTTIFTYEYKNGFWTCINQSTRVSKNETETTTVTETDMINIYYIQDLIAGPIVLMDNDEIKISLIEYLNKASWWEFSYKLKVENKSNKTITYMIDNASIMNINCDPLFNVDYIEAGCCAYFNIAWDKDTLERCFIPYIDNIKFMIKIYNTESWTTPALYGTKVLIKHEN